jgi:hypothetical protein
MKILIDPSHLPLEKIKIFNFIPVQYTFRYLSGDDFVTYYMWECEQVSDLVKLLEACKQVHNSEFFDVIGFVIYYKGVESLIKECEKAPEHPSKAHAIDQMRECDLCITIYDDYL